MTEPIVRVEGIGKRYRIGAAQGKNTTLKSTAHRCSAQCRCAAQGRAHAHRGVLGASRHRPGDRAGRRRRPRRAQRRRQVDAAEDPLAHRRAHDRQGDPRRPGREPARGRHRLPRRAHRSREHLPQRRDPRHAAPRDPGEVRRDRRVRGDREVPRHAGEVLLVGHVRAARLRGRRAPRARHPDRRRGAGGRRRGVPAEVARQDELGRALRPDGDLRQPQHRPRSSTCATTARCSRAAASRRPADRRGRRGLHRAERKPRQRALRATRVRSCDPGAQRRRARRTRTARRPTSSRTARRCASASRRAPRRVRASASSSGSRTARASPSPTRAAGSPGASASAAGETIEVTLPSLLARRGDVPRRLHLPRSGAGHVDTWFEDVTFNVVDAQPGLSPIRVRRRTSSAPSSSKT